MAPRVCLVVCLLLLAASAAAAGPSDRKQAIDEKIGRLRDRIAAANQREGVLTSEISRVTARIRSLQDDVARTTNRLQTLEGELAAYERRLALLSELLRRQTERLELLRRQQAIAERRLNERLVAIYQARDPTAVEVVLSAATFADLVDGLDYVSELGRQDRRIAGQVTHAKRVTANARARTSRTRRRVQRASEAIRARVAEQRAEQQRLVAARTALTDARGDKTRTLASVQESKEHFLHEVAGLERASASLAAAIRAAQAQAASRARAAAARSAESAAAPASVVNAPSVATVSARGFVWPVSGPVTSGFGWRWGRMHEGVDIAVPSGTPIRAAASGTVIYSGWMSGYGNLVVIDHGGGLSTAYAHQSSIGVGNGQSVGQGQTIGYVGCTGNCFGDHLHFEVRVNGAAVDPMGYL